MGGRRGHAEKSIRGILAQPDFVGLTRKQLEKMTGLGDKTVGCIRLYHGAVAGDDDGLPLVVDVNVYKGLMEVGLVARARGGTVEKGYVKWPHTGCMESVTPSAAEVQVQLEAQLREADAPAQDVEEISLRLNVWGQTLKPGDLKRKAHQVLGYNPRFV